MSHKYPYDTKSSNQKAHHARQRGRWSDSWASSESGKAILSARADDAFGERLRQGGLSEPDIEAALEERSARRNPIAQSISSLNNDDVPSDSDAAIKLFLIATACLFVGAGIGYWIASQRAKRL